MVRKEDLLYLRRDLGEIWEFEQSPMRDAILTRTAELEDIGVWEGLKKEGVKCLLCNSTSVKHGCDSCTFATSTKTGQTCGGSIQCKAGGEEPCNNPKCKADGGLRARLCPWHADQNAGRCVACAEKDDWWSDSDDDDDVLPKISRAYDEESDDEVASAGVHGPDSDDDEPPVAWDDDDDDETYLKKVSGIYVDDEVVTSPAKSSDVGEILRKVFNTVRATEPTEKEVDDILGGQKALVTKLMNTKDELGNEKGRAAAEKETQNMINRGVWKDPVPIESIPESSHVFRSRLLISIKHWESGPEKWQRKARFVGLGHMIFSKWMRLIRDAPKGDYWCASSSLADMRLVLARSVMRRRSPQTIDLIQGYLQTRLGGDIPIYVILEKEVMDLVPPSERKKYEGIRCPVNELVGALYGIARSGFDFSVSFQNWLLLNGWTRIEEAPGIMVLWHDEDEAAAMRRARGHKQMILAERAKGNEVLHFSQMAQPKQPARWSEVYLMADEQDADFDDKRKHCKSSSDCSVLCVYVDDSMLDSAKEHKAKCWGPIRLFFESDEPRDAEKMLGVQTWVVQHHSLYQRALSQSEYVENIVKEYEARNKCNLRICTTPGQQGPPPKFDELEKCEAGKDNRKVIGETNYGARGTRPDFSFTVGRLRRYVDRWQEWADAEVKHFPGYAKGTSWYALIFTNGGGSWEDIWVALYCDSDFNIPKSTSGWLITLEGLLGSFLATGWVSRLQTLTLTASAESESVAWSGGAKDAVRTAAIIEKTRFRRVNIHSYCDNERLRLACSRGYSPKMSGHMGRTAESHFRFWNSIGMIPQHLPGIDNPSDALTKVVGGKRMVWLTRMVFFLDAERNERGTLVVDKWSPGKRVMAARIFRHEGYCGQSTVYANMELLEGTKTCLCMVAKAKPEKRFEVFSRFVEAQDEEVQSAEWKLDVPAAILELLRAEGTAGQFS